MKRKKKYLVAIVLAVCFAIYEFYTWQNKIELTERFISALPASIEPDGYAMRNVSIGLLNAFIPDSCGVTAIHISDKTANRIKQQGLSFFDSAKKSRPHSTQKRRSVVYKNWQNYSVPPHGSLGDSFIMAVFDCAGQSGIPASQIIKGLKSGNAYYSNTLHNDTVYVLPDQKLFVHAFFD